MVWDDNQLFVRQLQRSFLYFIPVFTQKIAVGTVDGCPFLSVTVYKLNHHTRQVKVFTDLVGDFFRFG